MPADTIIIGKRHKTEHFNILLKGRCILFNEDGTQQELIAPATFVSGPGVQKVLLIIEETVWQTVHVTANRDLESIEAELIEPDDYPILDRTAERDAIVQAAQRLLK